MESAIRRIWTSVIVGGALPAAILIGGDYIVGLFVFVMLMIINLVVITKGAGPVSEVSARFTLDTLAGKQMAIDAGDCLDGISGRACKDPSFGLDEAQSIIDTLKQNCPHLMQGSTPAPYSLATITAVCRALLAERVPLRDFRRVAEAMVDTGGQELSLADLAEAVQQRIGALIVQGIVPVKMPLPANTFDPELEALLTQAVRTGPQTSWPFEPELARQIIAAIDDAVQPLLLAARSFVVITSPVRRAAVSRLLIAQFADVAVLSFLEIPETKAVEIIATIGGKKAVALLSADSEYEKEE